MIVPNGFPKLPGTWEYETEVHESLDRQQTLFFNIFRKKGVTPKRGLLIIHGQGEHGARYQHFPHYLNDVYDLIVAPDLRGHGRSEGVRGHVNSFDEYVDDSLLAWDILKSKTGANVPRDWFGHSMGGLVTLRTFLFRPDLDAKHVTVSSPLLGVKVPVPTWKELLAKALTQIWGSLQLPTALDASKVSHDKNVVEAYERDQLRHGKATPNFYFSMLSAINDLVESDLRFKVETPILFQIAGEDEIVDADATKRYFEILNHEKKTLIVYPGLYHEIYNETTKENVFHDWIHWMEEQDQNS